MLVARARSWDGSDEREIMAFDTRVNKLRRGAVGLLAFSALIAGAQTQALPDGAPAASVPAPAGAEGHKQAQKDNPYNGLADLMHYRDANARLGPPAPGENRVVFMGDSITEFWGQKGHDFFPGKPYINRGISGQTTPQILLRFRADVVALRPRIVILLAGTNDIAGNMGPATPEMIEDNLMSMADLAKANGIRVVLASALPAYDFPWRPGLAPAGKIAALNAWAKGYAARNGLVYLDYYSAMVDGRQGLKAALSGDGVHPNEAGYALMTPLAEKAIAQALNRR